MAKVYIGIGHGGADPGAMSGGFSEKDLTLTIGKACVAELKRHGLDVMISRSSDVTEALNDKIKECNAFKPDLCIDIHINAGGGDGAEIFHSVVSSKGKALGKAILDEIIALGQNSRGLKTRTRSDGRDYYAFIRDTAAPAVILECAFIDTPADLKMIDTKGEQDRFGKAVAKGILKNLGIAYRAEEAEKSEYLDRAQIPEWAEKAVDYVTAQGYMIGDGGYFRPDAALTRAEMAVILHRLKK